jgi:hypothetical protein
VQPDSTPTETLDPHAGTPGGQIQLLRGGNWQMSFGERAALEGLLSQLEPQLAIEIGTAEGGSLARMATHSREVHSFDLLEPRPAARELPNVTFHTGDSHTLLPELLARLTEAGRNVDFVLVDGDHSAEGVCQDVEDLLASPAIGRTLIVVHDTMNESVRAGLESVRYDAYPKVDYVELDFVAGYMFREPSLLHELWGGLGLVIVDAARDAHSSEPARQGRYYETFELVRSARELVVDQEQGSASRRLTAPLRAVKRRLAQLMTGR